MCAVCGCGHSGSDAGRAGREHSHSHSHTHHAHSRGGEREGQAGAPEFDDVRLIAIEESILSKNDAYAAANRHRFGERQLLALNLMSSPGAGKTTLLVRTIECFGNGRAAGVIEGDQATSYDADRIRATGVEAVQINTGRGCHLDAHMVGHALDDLSLPAHGIVFIENIGNLVCPATFDLGEAARVVVLSVAEGDDKPLKYPDMFAAADLMILSKIDLLPYVDFDADKVLERAQRLNPALQCLKLSARDGTGMAAWLDWIESRAVGDGPDLLRAHVPAPAPAPDYA